MRSARHVARHEKTAKALDAGDITAAHVELAARAAKHRQDLYPEHEDVILDAARSLPPAGFRVAMQHWRKCADAVADHRETVEAQDRWHLDAAATFDGAVHLQGLLDPIGGAALLARLDEIEPPDPTDGPTPPRSLAQRRAAALVKLVCGRARPPINIDVTVDVDTLAGRPPIDLVSGCCEIRGHGPVSPALRRSLDLRDRGCVQPGCTAPAAWCDAHHIVHWTRHGPTRLDNLELRCRTHHLLQHERDLEAAVRRRE